MEEKKKRSHNVRKFGWAGRFDEPCIHLVQLNVYIWHGEVRIRQQDSESTPNIQRPTSILRESNFSEYFD